MMFFKEYGMLLLAATGETLYMVVASAVLSYVLGLPLGFLLYSSDKGSLCQNKAINLILGWIINVIRSVPFIILIVALIPFTRLVAGKAIGATAAIVPLVIAAAPFVARMVETSIHELDPGVIDCARAMGATDLQIIIGVILPEILPSLVRGMSITTITLVGYTAMAGAVGAGGLGDVAIRYGYHRYEYGVMAVTIIILVGIVQVIQAVFSLIARKIDKSK